MAQDLNSSIGVTPEGWRPPAPGREHILVVVRIEEPGSDLPLQERVSVTKAFATVEEAQQEVDRLNVLNGPKGCRYAWYPARFVTPAGAGSAKNPDPQSS